MFAFGDKEWPGLAKLNEESGELVQVIGKLMMTHGNRKYWENVDLRQCLIEEMADQAAAIGFVVDHVLTENEILAFEERRAQKRARFEQWHSEQMCERNGEVERLKREQAALVRVLGENTPP